MTKTAGQILAGSLDMDRDKAQEWSRHQVGTYFINEYLCLRYFFLQLLILMSIGEQLRGCILIGGGVHHLKLNRTEDITCMHQSLISILAETEKNLCVNVS